MKSAGYLVSPTAEFTARMQNGKYHFHRRDAGFMVDPHRNTTSIINNRNGIILINCNINGITITRQGFIHCIVYNLVNQMVKASG